MTLTKYNIYNSHDLTNASTQTEEFLKVGKSQEIRTMSIESSINDSPKKHRDPSPPSSSSTCSSAGKTDTLESLIRADVNKSNCSVRLLEEHHNQIPANTKLRGSNKLLQLISCGSISSEDDNYSSISSFRSRSLDSKYRSGLLSSSVMSGELDCSLENKDYLLLKKEDTSSLKRSSSYSANRINKRDLLLAMTKCKKQSKRMDSFREKKENLIKIDERLSSGARVIISTL